MGPASENLHKSDGNCALPRTDAKCKKRLGLLLRGQGVPSCERVHIVSPMGDLRLSILTIEQNRLSYFTPVATTVPWTWYSMTGDAAVVRLVQNQLVGGPKHDVINVALNAAIRSVRPLITRGQPGTSYRTS